MPNDPLEIAERLFAAVTAGDVAAVRALYTDETRIWHNHDGVAQTAAENLQLLEGLTKSVRELRYENVRRLRTAEGFVQQHLLCGRTGDGRPFAVPACMVVKVENGKVIRIDEYFDSAQIAPVLGG